MPAITGLIGFNPSSGTARLLVAYGPNIVNLATNTGYAVIADNANDVEFEKFLDRIFFQNNVDLPLTYRTSTNVWSKEYVGRTPISKYIKKYKSRLYLGYSGFVAPQPPQDTGSAAISFPSRVFHSDLFEGNTLTWGIEWGRNGATIQDATLFRVTADSPLVQDFKTRNIKVGDPIFITNGNASLTADKPYQVTAIQSAYRLTVDRAFPVTATGQHFWVGSNWFDVSPDDGDEIRGFGENSDSLLIFKLYSLWIYTRLESSSVLRQVPGAVGTSYNRSIINDRFGNTYYFHGSDPKISGIYKYSRGTSVKISTPIDPFIQAMSTGNYSAIVAWSEGNEIRFFLGNLSATNVIDAMTNAVATLNINTDAWSVDPIADTITAVTTWRTGNEEDTFLGTNDDEVLQVDDGYSFNGSNIRSRLETKVYYPAGSEVINTFPYVQIVSRNAKGLRLKYKLWDVPFNSRYSVIDQDYAALGEVEGDLTEFVLPSGHYTASGIQFLVDELSQVENDWYIEKISIFYKPERGRLS